jgi:hypothetical protein
VLCINHDDVIVLVLESVWNAQNGWMDGWILSVVYAEDAMQSYRDLVYVNYYNLSFTITALRLVMSLSLFELG